MPLSRSRSNRSPFASPATIFGTFLLLAAFCLIGVLIAGCASNAPKEQAPNSMPTASDRPIETPETNDESATTSNNGDAPSSTGPNTIDDQYVQAKKTSEHVTPRLDDGSRPTEADGPRVGDRSSVSIIVQANTRSEELADSMTATLVDEGYDVRHVTSFDYPVALVVYRGESLAADAFAIAENLGIEWVEEAAPNKYNQFDGDILVAVAPINMYSRELLVWPTL